MQQVWTCNPLPSSLINNEKFRSGMMLNLPNLKTASCPVANRASELARMLCSFCEDFALADDAWQIFSFSKTSDLVKPASLLLTCSKIY
jgi:hypothetical protein